MSVTSKDDVSSILRYQVTQGPDVSSQHVRVIVGQGEAARTFYVHKTLLTQHSDFFVASLKNDWKEADERTVRLPDDSPEHFEIFARFAYTGKMFICAEGDSMVSKDDKTHNKEWTRISRCWILGDKLLSTTFKDATCDALCDKIKHTTARPTALHHSLYPASAATALIRPLLVDIAVWKFPASTWENSKMGESWNEFFKDVVVRLCKSSEQERKGTPPFANPGCRYHEHVAAKTACYKTIS